MKKYVFPKSEEAKKAEELERIKLAEEEMQKRRLKEEKERKKLVRSPLSWHIKEAGMEQRMLPIKSPEQPENPTSLTIAVIGAPNAGKSTLVNRIVGAKITAVSPKAQTTRTNLYGIATTNNTQLIFTDTPGIVSTRMRKKINSQIVSAAWNATDECDYVMVVVDAVKTIDVDLQNILIGIEKRQRQFQKDLEAYRKDKEAEKQEQEKLMQEIKKKNSPKKKSKKSEADVIKSVEIEIGDDEFEEDENFVPIEGHEEVEPVPLDYILVLNKVDLADDADDRARLIGRFEYKFPTLHNLFKRIFLVSAKNGKNVEELKEYLTTKAEPREWLFPKEYKSSLADLQIVEEIIREKIFKRTNKEIPYQTRQENVGFTPCKNGDLRIDQVVHVTKNAHKRILVGTGASVIAAISQEAREDLSKYFGKKVHLFLTVKIRERMQN
jgi:GTP-binding protein Era